eukprot:CAMPEP_0117685734 /NCGR_PEP_ID=MMETSP0804-20121206/21951_1 /TAXON_ID=1074897 /ORGANISM="Tetraselmis astigmatica, Strain CCMP880" /LENGTH=79 /DNA_ID=CAMNT_0005497133 /DNA_START=632 /DNA_END=868 /DNA_ORIENTATION=+
MKSMSREEAKDSAAVETILRSPESPGQEGKAAGGSVLVSGATTPLGAKVVKALLAEGRKVRVVSSDSQKSKAVFRGSKV